jgi:nicotinamide-nucleotide adenylyltransferase
MCPRFDVAYSNNPLVIQLFEEAGVPVRQSPMFHREVLEGTQIRERMIAGEDWQELVPNVVAETIEGIDGVARLQHLDGSDGVDAEDLEDVESIDDIEDIDTVADLGDTDPSG